MELISSRLAPSRDARAPVPPISGNKLCAITVTARDSTNQHSYMARSFHN